MSDEAETIEQDEDDAPAQTQVAERQGRNATYEASKALAVRNQGGAVVPMPTDFAQMQDFAYAMAAAGPMVGGPFRNRMGACLGILTQAMRWGMDPYAVSQKAYIAAKPEEIAEGKGAIAYEGQLVAAVIQKNAPLQKRLRYTFEGDGLEMTCTVTGYLRGEDEPFIYKSPTAAKLKKKSPLWVDDTAQQLVYYSTRAWARRFVPEIIMGVYTPDEVAEMDGGGPADAVKRDVIKLSDEVPEAEFTPIDRVIENRKPKAPAKPKPAAKEKAAAPKDDGQVDGLGDGGVARDKEGDKQKTATPAADAGSQDEGPTDEEIVAGVEAAVKKAKSMDKAEPIKAAKGVLSRIAETSEDEKLKARAASLLNRYDLE